MSEPREATDYDKRGEPVSCLVDSEGAALTGLVAGGLPVREILEFGELTLELLVERVGNVAGEVRNVDNRPPAVELGRM